MFFADAHALLNNDFTRANSTFSKRRFEESKMSSMQGKKARESGKMLERKMYENTGDVSYLRDEKPHFEEGLPGAEMSKQRALGNKMDFATPEYHGKTKRDLWSGADVPLAMENTDRNLSKKYLGKIDVNKRDTKYQEYLARPILRVDGNVHARDKQVLFSRITFGGSRHTDINSRRRIAR